MFRVSTRVGSLTKSWNTPSLRTVNGFGDSAGAVTVPRACER